MEATRHVRTEAVKSSFICALRRFFTLCDPASLLRCDRGTNFMGAKSELDDALGVMNQRKVERYIRDQGFEWLFNPPHASHFKGAWEYQIGMICSVLDAMLTTKTCPLGPPPGNFVPVDLYAHCCWRHVQYLDAQFWIRWRQEYMQTMQTRTK